MIVIDSSVVFKWFSTDKEPNVDSAIQLLEAHRSKREIIIVPDLIVYEVANAWVTKSELTESRIKLHIQDLEAAKLQFISLDFNLVQKTVKFSKKYRVSVYDAIYAILASEKGCDLITADIKFAEKVNLPFIKKLSDYE